MAVLRVIDIETTGWAPPAEIVEIGRVDLVSKLDGWQSVQHFSSLYRPLKGMTVETMAVHHITDAMVAASPVCTPEVLNHVLMEGMQPDVFVAHNCSFERAFISDEACGNRPWICTLKCALRLWPDAAGHSNQVLRYWLDLELGDEAMPPHRAGPDAYVTAKILERMLAIATLDQLVAWTCEPKSLPKMPFGKHKNARWADIPADYLAWITRQSDMDADIIWCAKQELASR